ncbi:terminase gpA endonuclease subunit [Limisalsivibrio acetivorans]|uniref:terminase gpA endonuclease subunit n=1 Tax=Limisalsivibrio acetivorans TaxID=1304888 RepID=UPI0003B51884|nr:terminase gpA endonuclease subunit [Limisalsivibrio acetivorans]
MRVLAEDAVLKDVYLQFPSLADADLSIEEYFEIEYVSALPSDSLTCSEWAAKYRILTSQTTSVAGPWRKDLFPHTNGIMDAMSSGACAEIIIVGGTQVAKTESYLNGIGYFIHKSPGPMGLLAPNEAKAVELFNDRVLPMIENTQGDILKKICTAEGRKIRKKDLSFVGGKMYLAWGGSENTLSSRPLKIVFVDEEDDMPALRKYGSVISLIKERVKGFINSLIVRVGKPMHEGGICDDAENADYVFYPYVPCPDCAEEFVFDKKHLHPKDIEPDDARELAYYECPACSYRIKEKSRRQMLASLVWKTRKNEELYSVLEAGERLVISFRVSSFYSPHVTFGKMLYEYIIAKRKGADALRVYYNGYLAELYKPSVTVEEEQIAAIRRNLGSYSPEERLPVGVCVLTAAVDVQKDRLEVLVQGWGVNLQRWHIQHRVLYGSPLSDIPWNQLDHVLSKKYTHPSGASLPIICTVVDSGYETETVYAYTAKREALGVYAIKGASTTKAPMINGPTRKGLAKAQLYTLNVHILKKTVQAWLSETGKVLIERESSEGAIGYMHFNEECDESHFRQLTAETLVNEGKKDEHFEIEEHARNEIFDLYGYNYAALHISRVNIDEWAEGLRELMNKNGGSDD